MVSEIPRVSVFGHCQTDSVRIRLLFLIYILFYIRLFVILLFDVIVFVYIYIYNILLKQILHYLLPLRIS